MRNLLRRSPLSRFSRPAYAITSAPGIFIGDNRVLCRRTFNGRAVTYIVEANDKLISPRFIIGDHYELGATWFLLRNLKPDSKCIDAGTNFGYFSVLMGALCPQGQVIGIEADANMAALASENILLNSFKDRCKILNRAVSNSDDRVILFRRMLRSGNTSIAQQGQKFTDTMLEDPEQKFEASGLKLDDLMPMLEGRVDFMKIDIEGAEPLAFSGAAEIISRNENIKIIVEWSPGQIQAAGFDVGCYLDSIKSFGLKPHLLHFKRKPSPISFEDVTNFAYIADLLFCR